MKYLVTEDEFKSATVTEDGDLEFTRDNGVKVVAGRVRGADSTVPGPPGKDGSNVLPTQEAILQEITEDGPVKDQLNATIIGTVGRPAPSDGTAIANVRAATPQTVAVAGHSNFYGQGGDEALDGINGQQGVNRRSTNNPPDALMAALNLMYPSGFTLLNHTRSGEDSRGLLGAYANPNLAWAHGDVEFIWLDSNDFVAGIPLEENAENIATLAEQVIAEGGQPVFLGGHFMLNRDNTHNRQARAALVRRIAERYGTVYIDVTELLSGFESVTNIWTDGVHYSDAAFAMIGTRLAAMLGPRGLRPPRMGPGSVVLPNHQMILGGTPTTRTGSQDGFTIRLTAGQTAMLPFTAETPCDAIVHFWSDTGTNGVGTGRIRYALSKAGIPDKRVNIGQTGAANQPGVTVRGHTFRGGPDLLFVTCDTGTLEIERVEFVPVPQNLRVGFVGQNRAIASQLGGVALAAPLPGDTYSMAADRRTPLSALLPNGSDAEVRVDTLVTFGAGSGASSQAVTLIAGANRDQTWLGMSAGYAVRRGGGGAELIIRRFNADGTTTNLHVDAAYFTAGAAWTGVVSFVLSGGNLQVYMNGAAVGSPVALGWDHFYPGAYSGAGPVLLVHGCTVQGPVGTV